VSEAELSDQDVSGDLTGEEKVVPVSEAIRYRRRAQSAEKEAAVLAEEVSRLKEAKAGLEGEVGRLKADGALADALVAAGAADLEAAMLVARARMEQEGEQDAAAVVEALRKEKGYLFEARGSSAPGALKTAGVRRGRSDGQIADEAARRAAASGSRADVHEYMRRRRKFV